MTSHLYEEKTRPEILVEHIPNRIKNVSLPTGAGTRPIMLVVLGRMMRSFTISAQQSGVSFVKMYLFSKFDINKVLFSIFS